MFIRLLRWILAVPAALLASLAAHALTVTVGRGAYTYVTMDFEREGLLALLSEGTLRFTAAGVSSMCFVHAGTATAPGPLPRRTIAVGMLLGLVLLMGLVASVSISRREWLEIFFAVVSVMGGVGAFQQVDQEQRRGRTRAARVAY